MPDSIEDAIRSRCHQILGPHSEAALAKDTEALNHLRSLSGGTDALVDELLRWAFRQARSSATIRDEFVGNLMPDLTRLASKVAGRASRATFDHEDILQSSLGDSLPQLLDSEFKSRRSFLTFMANRMEWKARTKLRSERALKRGGEQIDALDTTPDADVDASTERSELSRLQAAESKEALALRVLELPQNLRVVLVGVLNGVSTDDLAMELGITRNAVQQRLQRARAALRQTP